MGLKVDFWCWSAQGGVKYRLEVKLFFDLECFLRTIIGSGVYHVVSSDLWSTMLPFETVVTDW